MIEQGTDEWLQQRCGLVTASCLSKVMATGRNGAPSATRATYMGQLIAERLTGKPAETFKSDAMQWGTDTEDQAARAYTFFRDTELEKAEFTKHPDMIGFGASPDRLAGTVGLAEFKCPNTATHIANLQGAKIKREYMLQMHGQMMCTGRSWCDFVSFDPRMPETMQLHVERVERVPDLCDEIRQAVIRFIAEMDIKAAALVKTFGLPEAA